MLRMNLMSSVFRVWERFKYSIRAPWFSSVNNIFRDEDRGCVYTNCRSELTPAWQPFWLDVASFAAAAADASSRFQRGQEGRRDQLNKQLYGK